MVRYGTIYLEFSVVATISLGFDRFSILRPSLIGQFLDPRMNAVGSQNRFAALIDPKLVFFRLPFSKHAQRTRCGCPPDKWVIIWYAMLMSVVRSYCIAWYGITL